MITILDTRKAATPDNSIGVESSEPMYAKDLANEALKQLNLPTYYWRLITDANGYPADRMTVKFVRIHLH